MRRSRTEGNAESRIKEKHEHGLLRRCLLIAAGLILGVNVYLWNARSLGGNRCQCLLDAVCPWYCPAVWNPH